MRILLAGGGSGGHVTPLKAIAAELAKYQQTELFVVTDRKFLSQTRQVFADQPEVPIKVISAGKLRRYTSKSLLWHLTHLPTLIRNVIDIFRLALGSLQAVWLFLRWRPDVVFCKGGYVCLPLGFVSRLYRRPLIIHDSDTRPGLTNRILSRWAVTIATGMPTSFYPYKKDKLLYTGIPIKAEFQPTTKSLQRALKQELRFDQDRPLLLVTGGGNGAVSLNAHIAAAAEQLLAAGWTIMQLAGQGKAEAVIKVRSGLSASLQPHWVIEEFADMPPRLLAADLVLTRTSASILQECANAQKICIGLPSPHLDDQKLNGQFFAKEGAIALISESDLSEDGQTLAEAVEKYAQAHELANKLHKKFAKPHAAKQLAEVIWQAGKSN